MELDKFLSLQSKAFQNGAIPTGLTTLKWDVAGRCDSPVSTTFNGKLPPMERFLRRRKETCAPADHKDFQSGSLSLDISQQVIMLLPCRKCFSCLKARSRLWRSRAYYEIVHSHRTWFCTFTLRPEERFKMKLKAVNRLRKKRVNFDQLEPIEQFAALHKEISREFTLYFKRLRKDTGAKLRYLLVAEQHKDGFPHYHAFIHECDHEVSKRKLEKQWKLGFSKFKLTDEHTAGYVTKYLSKSVLARVRASQRYGFPQGIRPKGITEQSEGDTPTSINIKF